MPYSNIVFVKLQIELLGDLRFTDMLNDQQKLLYLGLIILAGDRKNEIPNKPAYIKRRLNLQQSDEDIMSNIQAIGRAFSKMIVSSDFISFLNFEKIHNYIIPKKGNPREDQEKPQNKEIEKEYIKEHDSTSPSHYSDDCKKPIIYLNAQAGTYFEPTNKEWLALVDARFREGHTLNDFQLVIDEKVRQWASDPKMKNCIKPATLFTASHMEEYLSEALIYLKRRKG